MAYKEGGRKPSARSGRRGSAGQMWLLFGDETLNQLAPQIDLANPDLAATVARYDQARALAAEARGGALPQVRPRGGPVDQQAIENRPLRGATQPSYYGDDELGGVASYEIDLWGKFRNEAAAGRASAQASAADLAAMRLSLRHNWPAPTCCSAAPTSATSC